MAADHRNFAMPHLDLTGYRRAAREPVIDRGCGKTRHAGPAP